MDGISVDRLKLVHPILAARAYALDKMLSADGIHLRVTQGVRTWPEQDALYQQGRTAPGPLCTHDGITRPIGSCPIHPMGLTVTKAKPGQSMHNYGLAIDAVPDLPDFPDWHPDWNERDGRWKEFLDKAETCQLAEGATWRSFPDAPHLYPNEIPPDPDTEIRSLFVEGGMEGLWRTLNNRFNWN